MLGPIRTNRCARLLLAGVAGALAVLAVAAMPAPVQARFFVGVGVPFPGYYYGPGPYYGYPPPYAYAPPPGYYPPPTGYPTQDAYPPPGAPAPSAYAPAQPTPTYPPPAAGATPGYAPPSAAPSPSAMAAPAEPASPAITYTNKPAFTNSAGQTCREYKTTDASGGRPVDVFGTACKEADGQWRVVN